jgi:hypothetical protein
MLLESAVVSNTIIIFPNSDVAVPLYPPGFICAAAFSVLSHLIIFASPFVIIADDVVVIYITVLVNNQFRRRRR